MKSAQAVAQKFVNRASGASGDYVEGAKTTSKDQNARAIASAEVHKQATLQALNEGRFAAGLRRAGKDSWLNGVEKKGGIRYGDGVANSQEKYAVNSGRYDSARGAAESIPRGVKGSPANLQRVSAVVTALRKQKVGASA